MAIIAGANIPDNKRIVIALTYVYGIGLTTSKRILAKIKVDESTRVKDLTDQELVAIRKEVENYTVEADLRRQTGLDIKRLQEIGCYRGVRHRLGLPVRGQGTKNNSRTRKGPRKTIANKKG